MGAEQVLFEFGQGFDINAVETRDVKVSVTKTDKGAALRIASSHHELWPGITLKAPGGAWDLAPYEAITLDARNTGTNDVRVSCRVDNPGADGERNCLTRATALKPGESGVLRIPLTRPAPVAKDVKLFGMRGYPWGGGEGAEGSQTIAPANVTQLLIFVDHPKEDHVFEIGAIRAEGRYAAPVGPFDDANKFFPFIDEFGQYIHKDWPGKTHSLADLTARREAEDKELREYPGPKEWDKYGGWAAGPALKATGFFRVEKYEGKWRLVDPDGRLFFSHGIDCVGENDNTPIDDRAQWFRNLPSRELEFKECYGFSKGAIRDYYKDRRTECFDFSVANLIRKYGRDWKAPFAEVTQRRLRSWGVNTIGNWSSPGIYLTRRTPYVGTVGASAKPLQGSKGYWGQFQDVFDPSFKEAFRKRMAQEKGKTAGDPWCLGYFVDNELGWGEETSLAIATLVSPPDQAAKQVFVTDLKAKYGTIDKLNAAWDTSHASWDALLAWREAPPKAKARKDLEAFYTKTAEQYFKTRREVVKEVAPNQLYLGCRFAWVNKLAVAAAAKYCDVVSYNLYRYPKDAANFRLPIDADVPLIIGEFHFGALDRGLFHTGLKAVKDQNERAKAYREYVEAVLRHPQFVGCHWFKYRDEPTVGRPLDGENYQIGFLDLADTPYAETIAASRAVGDELYHLWSQP